MTHRCPPTRQKAAAVGAAHPSGGARSGQGVSAGRGFEKSLKTSRPGLSPQWAAAPMLPKSAIAGPGPAKSRSAPRECPPPAPASWLLSHRSRPGLGLLLLPVQPESLHEAPEPSVRPGLPLPQAPLPGPHPTQQPKRVLIPQPPWRPWRPWRPCLHSQAQTEPWGPRMRAPLLPPGLDLGWPLRLRLLAAS